jgi:Protein of unknown function (DUF1501)
MFSTSIRNGLSRRDWLKLALAGVGTVSASGWLEPLARAAAGNPKRKRSCILLWMSGGPSTIDLWDLKPGHKNGGPFKEIDTAAAGVKIGEHLPTVAKHMKDLAIIRSMTTKEADHERATFQMRTGQLPLVSVAYPTLGSLVAKELEDETAPLPPFVSINSSRFFTSSGQGAGFLGARYAPLAIGEDAVFRGELSPDEVLRVEDVVPPKGVSAEEAEARVRLLAEAQREFAGSRTGAPIDSHRVASQRAVQLMRSEARKAFELGDEKAALRDAYGRSVFGQGCLLARRLVERGVPFVEVTLSGQGSNLQGWDTHLNNFDQVRGLCEVLDPAWGALMGDLKERGLLETTTVVWMGEFGRTPKINGQNGRDHWPNSWATVVGGGGIKGGQAVGKTSADGTAVEERPVSAADLIATVCVALGLDPMKENLAPNGRPIRLADKAARPVKEIIAG